MRRDDVSVLGNKSDFRMGIILWGITGVLEGFFVCNFAAAFFFSSSRFRRPFEISR